MSTSDRVLDALDEAPLGSLVGAKSFTGRLATIQQLSASLGCSDTATRAAVLHLIDAGLVEAFTAVDPSIHKRRIYVSGGA